MKGEPLQKPPPLLLPGKKLFQERDTQRFRNKYDDAYNGLIKRASELTLDRDRNGGNCEEESSSVRTRSSRSSGIGQSSGGDDGSSPFDDASSCTGSGSVAGSVGSDCCPPYEEVPAESLPPPTPHTSTSVSTRTTLQSFRDDLPSPPSPTTILYANEQWSKIRCNSISSSDYCNGSIMSRRRPSRSKSLYSNMDQDVGLAGDDSMYTNCPLTTASPTTITIKSENQPMNSERLSLESHIVTDAEKRQIEMFYRGLRTSLWVSSSLANLYSSSSNSSNGDTSWTFKQTGIPVIIFESGDTRSRDKRKIQIVLAERGTCFPLWRDIIDNLSSYRKAGHAFHTMHISSDHAQMIGLSFDSDEESERILKQIETLCADPENINISAPKKRNKKSPKKIKKPLPLPHKKDISKPCLFEHVIAVAARDKPIYMSLQTLVAREQLAQKILHHENIS